MKSANIVHLIPQNLCNEALRIGRTLYCPLTVKRNTVIFKENMFMSYITTKNALTKIATMYSLSGLN